MQTHLRKVKLKPKLTATIVTPAKKAINERI